MKVYVNYPTGAMFQDGTPEIGKQEAFTIETRLDLERVLDTIPEEKTGAFLTDENGEELRIACLMELLD